MSYAADVGVVNNNGIMDSMRIYIYGDSFD